MSEAWSSSDWNPNSSLYDLPTTYQPHECLNIDTLVLNQPDKHGNIAIIVVIDTFTRWLEMYPILDYTAEVAALKLLEHFGRYGAPKTILTDRGLSSRMKE